jgi:N6-L-threonylcarbamoyladenine synthase
MNRPRPHLSTRRALLLAIESSCDETAAAVIDRDLQVRSNVVQSQDELHRRFGGVVPELASRAHVRKIIPAIDAALRLADAKFDDLAAIAVTSRPGLVGSLLVGITAAKTLALALDLPLVDVNHVEAHLFACQMSAAPGSVFPAVGLVVSGGHTLLYDCRSAVEFEVLGSTIDDAAGEAFDKGAKLLGLEYPGGPSIDRAAASGNPRAVNFPRPLLDSPKLDFSFSGLKTALLYEIQGTSHGRLESKALAPSRVADLAASYQEAIVDVLVAKCRKAVAQTRQKRLLVGGGVAANRRLRERLGELAAAEALELVIAPPELCTDNAAMAAMAWEILEHGGPASLDLDACPSPIRKR